MVDYKIPGVVTFEFTKILGLDNIEFGRNIIIDDFVFIYAKNRTKIGNNTHIGTFSSIIVGDRFSMGDFSAISHGCRVFTRSDDYTGWGFGNPAIDEKYRNIKSGPVNIGKFAIIGANSVILPGVSIGEGATVGACSVVTHDLEPWGIYVRNKKVKDRDKEGVLTNYERYLEENQ